MQPWNPGGRSSRDDRFDNRHHSLRESNKGELYLHQDAHAISSNVSGAVGVRIGIAQHQWVKQANNLRTGLIWHQLDLELSAINTPPR
jgi:hypothetical protein